MLNICGLYLGPDEDMMPAQAHDNPLGYWENLSFTRLNDDLLEALDGSWNNPPTPESGWWKQPAFDPFRERAAALIENFEERAPWGWKDPRSCITLPFWLDLIPDLHVVFCLRNPLEITWSLSRGGETRSFLAEQALALWQTYHEQLFSQALSKRFITTHYASYFYQSQTEFQRVLDGLDMAVNETVIRKAIATITPDMRHIVYASRQMPQKEVPRRIAKLYDELCDQAGPVFEQLMADDAYWLEQQKDNEQKRFALLRAEADRSVRAQLESRDHQAAREYLYAEVNRLEDEKADLEANNTRLVESAVRLSTEKTRLETERAALAESVKDLESQNRTLHDAVIHLEDEKTALTESVERLEGEKSALAEVAGRLEGEKPALAELAGRLKGEKAVLAGSIKRLESQYAEKETENIRLTAQVGRLEGEKATLTSERRTLTESIKDLRGDKLALAETIGKLEGEKIVLTQTVNHLESQRAEQEAETIRLAALAERLKGEKAMLEAERAALAETITVLEEENAVHESERAALTELAVRLESEKSILVNEKSALVHQKNTLMTEKSALVSEKNALVAEREALTDSVRHFEQERASHEADKKRLLDWVHALEDSKTTLRAQRDHLLEERNAVLHTLVWRIAVKLQALRRAGFKRILKKTLRGGRPASPVQIFLDHPSQHSAPVSEELHVSGWAVSRKGAIERVEASLDGNALGSLRHGIDRPDVGAAFPKISYAGRGGYEQRFSLAGVPSGEHELVVQATDAAGNSRAMHRRIVVAASVGAAAPRAALPAAAPPPPPQPADKQAAPAEEAPAPAPPRPKEEQSREAVKKKYITVDRAVWHDGYLEIEGLVMWPNSQAPRMVHIWMGDQHLGEMRCNLSRPEVTGRLPDDLKPYCQGFRLSWPLPPKTTTETGRKKTPFVIEIVDKNEQKFRRELSLRYEGGTDQSQGAGFDRAFKAFVIEYQTRLGREPSVLDWNTGLQLKQRFPKIAILTPPMPDERPRLPYVDKSIDVVFYHNGDPAFTEEARRVASGAVLTLEESDEQAEPQIKVTWQDTKTESALPSASIIIPVYNQSHYTRQVIEQLRLTLPRIFNGEVIVVDDCSTDDTPGILAALAKEWPALKVMRNPENLGFIGSCNRGAEASTGEFILFLNNDTLPQPGWFVPLLNTFEQYDDAGAAGGKLIYPDGTLQEAGGIIFSDGSGWNFGRNDPAIDHPLYNHVREVDYCSGALLMTRRETFMALGGFDTRYKPAYYEDTDYCFQLRQQGLKVYYQPESVVVHFEGISSGTDLTAGVKKHQVINKKKFVEKWRETLKHQPPPPPNDQMTTRYWLVVRDELEKDEVYAY